MIKDPILKDLFQRSQTLLDIARQHEVTISVAESCTGGLLGAAITAMPGSSAVFEGGFLTYSNRLKMDLLGVSEATLKRFGAVSEETAAEMARGTQERLGTTLAVSVTGIAGPDGGTDEKPVGTVCFGLANADGVTTNKQLFEGHSRNRVRDHAVLHALTMLTEAARN